MSALLIWINMTEALLFQVETNGIAVEKVQQTSSELSIYELVLQKMKTKKFKVLLLMGPQLGGVQFAEYLERAAPEIVRKLIGVQQVDPMPESEILSVGQKYLQRYYLYNPL